MNHASCLSRSVLPCRFRRNKNPFPIKMYYNQEIRSLIQTTQNIKINPLNRSTDGIRINPDKGIKNLFPLRQHSYCVYMKHFFFSKTRNRIEQEAK